MLRLSNKTVLITGASKGIGRALALGCAREGADVIVNYHTDRAGADEFQAQAQRMPKDLDWPDPYVAEYLRRALKRRNRYRTVEQLEAAGRYGEAITLLVPMTEQSPDDSLPLLTLGKILGRRGTTDGPRSRCARRFGSTPTWSSHITT